MAAIDSYAQVSCVSKTLVETLEVSNRVRRPAKNEQQFLRAFDDSKVKRIGTVQLRMACGTKNLSHEFEVIEGSDDMLIGLDLFPKLGIYLGGVPHQWPDEEAGKAAAKLAADRERELVERPAPFEIVDRIPEFDQLQTELEPLLRANEQIPVWAPACPTIPEATMRLPLTIEASYRRPYGIPEAARPAVEKAMLLWDVNNYIEPGDPACDYNTPLAVASKKDLNGMRTDWRICLDFRHINAALDGDMATYKHSSERMPHIHDVLKRMEGFTICSTLDLRHSYHQLPIHIEDRDKTTFTYGGKKWRWKRWPFGLTPATTKFQKVMETVLQGLEGVAIFVDDIAIFTKGDVEEHKRLVEEVLRRLNLHCLRVNRDKCHFGYKRVLMLGHLVSGTTRAMDPLKRKQALAWTVPKTAKDVQRFLGFTNYIRDYIPLYAKLTQPLNALRHVRGKFELTAEQRLAFDNTLRVINSPAVLSTPDPNLPFQPGKLRRTRASWGWERCSTNKRARRPRGGTLRLRLDHWMALNRTTTLVVVVIVRSPGTFTITPIIVRSANPTRSYKRPTIVRTTRDRTITDVRLFVRLLQHRTNTVNLYDKDVYVQINSNNESYISAQNRTNPRQSYEYRQCSLEARRV
jgi:hypothetical protein